LKTMLNFGFQILYMLGIDITSMLNALTDFNSLDSKAQLYFEIVLLIAYLLGTIFIKTSLRSVNGYKLGFGNRCLTMLIIFGINILLLLGANYLIEEFLQSQGTMIHIVIVGIGFLLGFLICGVFVKKLHNTTYGSGLGAIFITGFLLCLILFIAIFASQFFLSFNPIDSIMVLLQF
jgi:hypothetical protein